MATRIEKSAFTTDSTIETLWHADTGSTVQTVYVYVSSACFDAYYTAKKNWGSWGRTISLSAYYYNGSSWIKAGATQSDSPGQFDSGTYSKHFRHNWSGYTQNGDMHNFHLWRLEFGMPELYNKYIYLQCGSYYYGAEDWTGKKIYGTSLHNEKPYYYAGNTKDDAGAISLFKTSSKRGTKIYNGTILAKSIFFSNDVR